MIAIVRGTCRKEDGAIGMVRPSLPLWVLQRFVRLVSNDSRLVPGSRQHRALALLIFHIVAITGAILAPGISNHGEWCGVHTKRWRTGGGLNLCDTGPVAHISFLYSFAGRRTSCHETHLHLNTASRGQRCTYGHPPLPRFSCPSAQS